MSSCRGGAGRMWHRHGVRIFRALCYSWNLLFLIHSRVKEKGKLVSLNNWRFWYSFVLVWKGGRVKAVSCDSTGLNSNIFPLPLNGSLRLNRVQVVSCHVSWCTASDSSPAPFPLPGIHFNLWDMVELLCQLCHSQVLVLKQSSFHAAGSL